MAFHKLALPERFEVIRRIAAEQELAARGGAATPGLVQLYFPGIERTP